MSRSYKKHPVYTDYIRGSTHWQKTYANRMVRRFKHDIANGKAYRKIYNPWNIHDWKEYMTELSARKWFRRNYSDMRCKYQHPVTEYYYINKNYKKYFKRK